MGTPIFWVEQVPEKYQWTYSCFEPGTCPIHGEGHRAEKLYGPGTHPEGSMAQLCPRACACGHTFSDDLGVRSGHGCPSYRRLDNGEEIHGNLPTGACYVLDDDAGYQKGFDGHAVVCVLPNGDHWHIDSRCSNCTMPDDNIHRCWVRHGTVGEKLHVDKNGQTCAAGAGSIQSGDYHGFLHNGELNNA